jgi:hypothetical protein
MGQSHPGALGMPPLLHGNTMAQDLFRFNLTLKLWISGSSRINVKITE